MFTKDSSKNCKNYIARFKKRWNNLKKNGKVSDCQYYTQAILKQNCQVFWPKYYGIYMHLC